VEAVNTYNSELPFTGDGSHDASPPAPQVSRHEQLLPTPRLLLPEPARRRLCLLRRPQCEGHAGIRQERCKELGIAGGEGRVRINKAGCLNRCELGPVLVVYPEAVWYTFVDEQDIDEIIESHLINGKPVSA
jgi:(2Fe-2S) ferredoxin